MQDLFVEEIRPGFPPGQQRQAGEEQGGPVPDLGENVFQVNSLQHGSFHLRMTLKGALSRDEYAAPGQALQCRFALNYEIRGANHANYFCKDFTGGQK